MRNSASIGLLLVGLGYLGLGSVVSGCGQANDGYSAEGKEPACEEQCQVLSDCDDAVDESACVESCVTNEAISRQGQDVITGCIEEQECSSSNPVQVMDCIDDGLGDLPPSAAGTRLCTEAIDKLATCSDQEVKEADRSDCLDAVSVLADSMVNELSDCALDKDNCTSRQLCLLGVLSDLDLGGSANPADQTFEELLRGFLGPMNPEP